MRRGSRRRSADIRDWVLRFNARGPDGLVDGKHRGTPSTPITAAHWRRLLRPARPVAIMALGDVRHLARRDHLGRELKHAKISARPRHYAISLVRPLQDEHRPKTRQGWIVPRRGRRRAHALATPTPWRRTSSRSPPSIPAPMRIRDAQAGDPRQHHPGAAATIARVEPGGECLAIHARQCRTGSSNPTKTSSRCAAKNNLIDQPWKHVPRHMGAWVLINDRWYK